MKFVLVPIENFMRPGSREEIINYWVSFTGVFFSDCQR